MGEPIQNETIAIAAKQWDDPIDWKELGVFTDESAKWELLGMCVFSAIFFYVQFRLAQTYVPIVCRLFSGDKNLYFEMPKKVQAEYVSRVVSDIHSFIALAMSWYGCFYACEDPTATIFNSFDCVMKPARV